MARWTSLPNLLGSLLLGGSTALMGCQPTPDYRITALNIPADAALLLVGWKSESDTVPRTSLAVPVGQLSPEQRERYIVALNVGEVPDASGVVSLATVDKNLCITSVVNAEHAPRSSNSSVSMVEVELNPNINPNVAPRALVPTPPVMCPPNPPLPPYPAPVSCARVPGLGSMPTEPVLVPTRPVVINAIRQLKGPSRSFDGGKLSFYGWGFDRASIVFGAGCDPSKCFLDLQTKYPQYIGRLVSPMSFRYPDVNLVSYAQIDLQVPQIKKALMVDPASGFEDGMLLCIAVSALSFRLTNPGGAATDFSEVLPRL